MPSISKCLVLLCVSAVLLVAAGAFADVDASTAAFIRSLGTNLGTGWDTTANPCTYSGVTCVDLANAVYQGAEISLSGRGLTGTLPDSNGATFVTKIDLSNNNGITGFFPESWSSMIRVTDVDLSSTQLYGQIPHGWNGMRSLQNVKITNTRACYRLPSWSGASLFQILTVDLSSNYIYGITDTGFGALALSTTLQSVNINNNPLCGCADAQWMSNAVMTAAAQSALPSSVAATCFSTAGAACPNRGVCLAGTAPSTPSNPSNPTNPTSTSGPVNPGTGQNAASLTAFVSVAATAAIAAVLAIAA